MSLATLAKKLIKSVGDEKGSSLLDKVKDRTITASEIKEIRDAGIEPQDLVKELEKSSAAKAIDKVEMPKAKKAKAKTVKKETAKSEKPVDKAMDEVPAPKTAAAKKETETVEPEIVEEIPSEAKAADKKHFTSKEGEKRQKKYSERFDPNKGEGFTHKTTRSYSTELGPGKNVDDPGFDDRKYYTSEDAKLRDSLKTKGPDRTKGDDFVITNEDKQRALPPGPERRKGVEVKGVQKEKGDTFFDTFKPKPKSERVSVDTINKSNKESKASLKARENKKPIGVEYKGVPSGKGDTFFDTFKKKPKSGRLSIEDMNKLKKESETSLKAGKNKQVKEPEKKKRLVGPALMMSGLAAGATPESTGPDLRDVLSPKEQKEIVKNAVDNNTQANNELLQKGKDRTEDKEVINSITIIPSGMNLGIGEYQPQQVDTPEINVPKKKEQEQSKAYLKSLDKYIKELSNRDLTEDPTIQTYLDDISMRIKQADDDYRKSVNKAEWGSLMETFSNALFNIGAGAYGLKHGVDMSGIKFSKTDWDKKIDKAMADLERKQSKFEESRKDLLDLREKHKKSVQMVRDKIAELKLKRGTEKDRLALAKQSREDKLTADQLARDERMLAREDRLAAMEGKKQQQSDKEEQQRIEKAEKLIKDNAKLEDQLRKEWSGSQVTQDTQKLASQYGKMKAVLGNPNIETTEEGIRPLDNSPAGDLALIFTYMKILDPTSVVREGEQELAIKSAAIPDRVIEFANKVYTGQKLTENQRKDFFRRASQMYEAQLKTQATVDKKLEGIIGRRGLNKDNVIDSSLYDLTGDKSSNEIKRRTKDGKTAIFDANTKRFIRYVE